MNRFSENLKNLRHMEGLSIRELAKRLNVSKSAVGMWEQGVRVPPLSMLENVADYFNVSIDALLGNEEFGKHKIDNVERAKLIDICMQIPNECVVQAYTYIKELMDNEKKTI